MMGLAWEDGMGEEDEWRRERSSVWAVFLEVSSSCVMGEPRWGKKVPMGMGDEAERPLPLYGMGSWTVRWGQSYPVPAWFRKGSIMLVWIFFGPRFLRRRFDWGLRFLFFGGGAFTLFGSFGLIVGRGVVFIGGGV